VENVNQQYLYQGEENVSGVKRKSVVENKIVNINLELIIFIISKYD
jgi:hypothetical protein